MAWLTNRTKNEVEQSQRLKLFSTFVVPDKYPPQNQSVNMTADDQTQDGGAATPLLVTTRPRVSRATSQEFGQADFQGWTRGGVTGMAGGRKVSEKKKLK